MEDIHKQNVSCLIYKNDPRMRIHIYFQLKTSLLDDKNSANAKTAVTKKLRNENENMSQENRDDVKRKKMSTPVLKRTVCRTMPFYFCYHITEKDLKITIGNNWNNAILLRRQVPTTQTVSSLHLIN